MIRRFAEAAKRWGHPFFLRFDWEMNGDWFAWGQRVNGNTPGGFVGAWRHVHHIFSEVGATNASWVWCPNVDPTHYWWNLYGLYPGDGYVDWTCLDGYNWGTTGPGSPGALRGGWQSFYFLYESTYQQIVHRIAPSKPMIIGEVGSSSHGGSEAQWLHNMFGELPTLFPRIHGFVWYDAPGSWGFPLVRATQAARAFASGVRSAAFASNIFCHAGVPLGPPPLPPVGRSCARN
jgi:hypothetical protein